MFKITEAKFGFVVGFISTLVGIKVSYHTDWFIGTIWGIVALVVLLFWVASRSTVPGHGGPEEN